MILICKKVELDGKIKFVVFDDEIYKTKEMVEQDVIHGILDKSIPNGKVENGVVKMTDSNHGIKTVRMSKPHKLYYLLDSYKSHFGNEIMVFVDESGQMYEATENVAVLAIGNHVVNATVKDGRFNVNKHTNFISHLSRPLHHVRFH